MSKDVIRSIVRSILGVLFVSITALFEMELRLGNTLSLCSFMTFAFVILALADRQWTALVGITVGALELALVLPGAGFAVADPNDALAMIIAISVGLLVAWFSRTQRTEHWRIFNELRAVADHEQEAQESLNELAHRLSNDFAMLVATCGTIGRRARSEETRSAMQSISDRVVVLGHIYHRLWPGEAGQNRVKLRSYFRELCYDLQRAHVDMRPITLDLSVEDIELPPRDAAILGMITSELLSNIYKHAFPDDRTGLIIVALRVTDPGMLVLDVIDNGVGFKKAVTQCAGLGHRLLVSLASQLHGALSFSRVDERTMVTVSVPLAGALVH